MVRATMCRPIAFTYWTFRIMVGVGFLMAAAGLYGLYLVLRDEQPDRGDMVSALAALRHRPALPGEHAGWLMTELGRQPWIVFGLMKTPRASRRTSGRRVLASLVPFTLVYGALMAADIYLLAKNARADDGRPEPHRSPKGSAFRAGGGDGLSILSGLS